MTKIDMNSEEVYIESHRNKETFVSELQNTLSNLDISQFKENGIENKLCVIRNVTKLLIEKAKEIEERRKYLETKNLHLKNENADLAKRYIQSQDKVNALQSKLEDMKVEMNKRKSVQVETSKMLILGSDIAQSYYRNSSLDKDVFCQTVDLKIPASTQTEARLEVKSTTSLLRGFHGARSQRSEMILSSGQENNEPVIVMSKKELRRLDSNMESLRMKLAMKEEAWAKTAEREREQRFKLFRLSNEMTSLKKIAQCRSQELGLKTRDLKMTRAQLDHAEREIKQLKKIILKTRTSSSNNSNSEVCWSEAFLKKYNFTETTPSEYIKKKKTRPKKIRKPKDQLDQTESFLSMAETYATNDSKETTDKESCASMPRPHTSIHGGRTYRDDTEFLGRPRGRRRRENMTEDRLQRVESDTLVKSFDPL